MNKTAKDFMEGRDRVERMATFMQNYFGTAFEFRGEVMSVPEQREIILQEHGRESRTRDADLDHYSLGLDGLLYIPLPTGAVRIHSLLKWLPKKSESTFVIKSFTPHPTEESFLQDFGTWIFLVTAGGVAEKPKRLSIFTAKEAVDKGAVSRYGGIGPGNRNRITVTIKRACSFRSIGGRSGFFNMSADDTWKELIQKIKDGSLKGEEDASK